MPRPEITKDDAENLKRLKDLLLIADNAFCKKEHFEFPRELNDIPSLVAALQHLAGKKKPIRKPFWKCVTALDKVQRPLRLKMKLKELFARPAHIILPGPFVQLWILAKTGELSPTDKESIEILDKLLNPVLRDIDGKVTVESPSPRGEALRKCSALLQRIASHDYKRLARAILGRDPAIDAMLDYAAFLDFYWRSRTWMERYYQPLVELMRLGEIFEHPPLFAGVQSLIHADYPDDTAVKSAVALVKNLKNSARVRKHRRKISS